MQISFDLLELTSAQREHVAGFLVTFPDMSKIPVAALEAVRLVSIPEVVNAAVESLEDPASAFGAAVPAPPASVQSGPVSTAGPHLVIPNPEPAGITAPLFGGITLDKAGLPWNERIHSENKGFNKDGTWRKKRGVDSAAIALVEAELRAVMAIPSPAPVTAPVPAAPVVPPPPGAAPAPAATEVNLRAEFVTLVGWISSQKLAQKLTDPEVIQICVLNGLPAFNMLPTRLDLVPKVKADLEALIGGKPA